MPLNYNRPHIDISNRVDTSRYKSPRPGRPPSVRHSSHEQHGSLLRDQLRAAFQEVRELSLPDIGIERPDGAYYEVELGKGSKAEKLKRKQDGVGVGVTKIDPETEHIFTVIFIPDASIPKLEQIFEEYASTPAGKKPPRQEYIDPIEAIGRANLLSFWTDDPDTLPEQEQYVWWEVWCDIESTEKITDVFRHLHCRIADNNRWLNFPEATVIPILARRVDVESATIFAEGILELRRCSDTPYFYVEEEREYQHKWINDLAERIIWPDTNVPRVCILDTGVNRAHSLIEPALSSEDLLTANPNWPSTDNLRDGHGTKMAGLALYGDLFPRLQDESKYKLRHRLESVRIIPSDGFPANEPAQYGYITLEAVSITEIQNPYQQRVFCLAVTNRDRSGDRASSWSASIDRAAAASLVGDDTNTPRRLFCIAAGNIPNVVNVEDLGELEDYPIEDPAQAWNALTIGGYTDKVDLDPTDADLEGYTAVANVGDISPFSRNSLAWRSGKTPIKPEVVFEAGNRVQSPDGRYFFDCSSLELLTTGPDVNRLPITTAGATSAATAQAARLAAQLQADHPDYWPETIRGLIVHSASWTETMEKRLKAKKGVRERRELARLFGYGVPSYNRATSSASSDLAIVAQSTIQPYRRNGNVAIFNDCHYYILPWPREVLEKYAEERFQLKVTLSYFIQPNPGKSAAIDPFKYQSFGLRFDLKRAQETSKQFKSRINKNEEESQDLKNTNYPKSDDSGWMFGPNSISAGSIHCDVWQGNGAQLAARNIICVKPVAGWWKERNSPEVCEQQARYALILTLTAPDINIDLYTPISTLIEPPIEPEIDLSI
jgi:hypothetical protein